MAETTPPAPAAAPAAPPGEMASAMAQAGQPLTVRGLLEAGAHFGHQTHRWNPRMKPFIFGERNGIHILDLDQTAARFHEALEFLQETAAAGGKVLFVGTKRQAQPPVQMEATRAGQLYVNNRWLGGTLTNFRTVRKSLDRFKEHLATLGDEQKVAELSKKERASMTREVERYAKGLEGLKEMGKLPAALFVIDVKREHIAVSEARRLGIPIVAVVDSNCDPDGIDFVVPANDDATRAIQLYCAQVADACVAGAALHEARVRSEVAEETSGRRDEAAGPGTGRVVVEIKQPPRRGRGARDGRGGMGGMGGMGGGRGGTRSAGVERDVVVAEPAPVAAAPADAPDGE